MNYQNELQEKNPIAVLIDADNVEAEQFENIFKELSNYGDPIIRRIYGDWSDNNLKKWKAIFQNYALNQHQVSKNAKNKNSTDISLVIDAMDINYRKIVKGFCIISSDSDYTKLVLRLREDNNFVIGIGNKDKTNNILVNSCDKFIYYNTLSAKYSDSNLLASDTKKLREDTKLIETIKGIIKDIRDMNDSDRINLGELKKRIVKLIPDFDSNNYGYNKFSDLIEEIGLWNLEEKNKVLIIEDENIKNEIKYFFGKIKSTGTKGYSIIIDNNNKEYKINHSEEKEINYELLSTEDEIVFEKKGEKAINVKLCGEVVNYGLYGFIKGLKGDIFISDKTVKCLKEKNIKIKVYDWVSYYKEEPGNTDKNYIAKKIEKINRKF